MGDIITFFKLLFFLKTVLITSTPIDIGNEWVSVRPQESLVAITGGAAIYIDVSRYVQTQDFDAVAEKFPNGTIEGELISKSNNVIALKNIGSSHSNDSVWLIVAPKEAVPVDVEYVEVRLKSKKPVKGVDVYWKNGKS